MISFNSYVKADRDINRYKYRYQCKRCSAVMAYEGVCHKCKKTNKLLKGDE